MTNELSQYKLPFNEVDENRAREAINKKRVCIVTFCFTNREFVKFITFFKDEPKGILSKEKMDEIIPYKSYLNENRDNDKTEGYAVVLIGSQIEYLRLLNSWGIDFAAKDFLKLKILRFLEKCIFITLLG